MRSFGIAFIFLAARTAFGQIPNAGFENWSGGNPVGWAVDNSGPLVPVTQSSTAHSGASALRGDVINYVTLTFNPTVQSGPTAEGFPYSGRPASFTGYYQFFPVGGDRFSVDVALFKGGVQSGAPVAVALAAITTSASSYTAFNVPFTYQTSDIPDTCVISFSIIGPAGGTDYHVGSYVLIDDIAFSGLTAVENPPANVPRSSSLAQNYPNPFNPSTTIRFTLASAGRAALRVYNILGQQVATLAEGEMTAGEHAAVLNASALPSGVYFYRLESAGFVETKQMLLVK